MLFNWNPPKVSVYIVNHSVNNYLLADTRLRYATTTFLYSCNITCCIYQTLINHQKGNRKIIFCCCCIDKHQLSCENPVRKKDSCAMHIKSEHWTPQKSIFACGLFLPLSAWWTSVGLSVSQSLGNEDRSWCFIGVDLMHNSFLLHSFHPKPNIVLIAWISTTFTIHICIYSITVYTS